MAKRATRKTLLILPFSVIGGIALLFTPAVPKSYILTWLAACAGLIGVAMFNAATKRPCGHGYIVQGKWGASWPFVIRECPRCGEHYN